MEESTAEVTRRPVGMRLALLVVGLLVAYSPSYVNVVLRHLGVTWEFIRGPQSVLLWNWLAVAALVLYILVVERRSLASVGLRRPVGADITWAMIFAGMGLGASSLVAGLLPPTPSTGMAQLMALPLPVIVGIVITTATTEELLFRGYPVERLGEATGSIWIGVAFSLGLFVLPHVLFFGPTWLLQQGVGVVLAYGLYVWRRNLFASMVMHGIGNAPLIYLSATAA